MADSVGAAVSLDEAPEDGSVSSDRPGSAGATGVSTALSDEPLVVGAVVELLFCEAMRQAK